MHSFALTGLSYLLAKVCVCMCVSWCWICMYPNYSEVENVLIVFVTDDALRTRGGNHKGRPAGQGDGVHRRPAARAVPNGRGSHHAHVGTEVRAAGASDASAHGKMLLSLSRMYNIEQLTATTLRVRPSWKKISPHYYTVGSAPVCSRRSTPDVGILYTFF